MVTDSDWWWWWWVEGIFDERHKPLTLLARRSPPTDWEWSVAAEIGPSKKKKNSANILHFGMSWGWGWRTSLL